MTKAQFRVVAINLHPNGIAEADRLATILRDEGWPRATRSLVVREALERLSEDLSDKSAEDIFKYFIERRGKRATKSALTFQRAGT